MAPRSGYPRTCQSPTEKIVLVRQSVRTRGQFERCAIVATTFLLASCGASDSLVDRLPIEVGDAALHNKINYIELKAGDDLDAMKAFYGDAFGWTFQEWGADYVSFEGAGLDGGFERGTPNTAPGGALVILYSDDLDSSLAAVEQAGGRITTAPFDFPGGRRFHFADPAGNELAVWIKQE
jgi:hypothetical protein